MTCVHTPRCCLQYVTLFCHCVQSCVESLVTRQHSSQVITKMVGGFLLSKQTKQSCSRETEMSTNWSVNWKTLTFSSWTRGGALQSNFSTLWNSSVTIKDLWSFTFREVAFVQDDTDLWSNSSRVWLDVGYDPPFTVIMVCTKVHYQQSEHNYKMKHCQVMSLTWVHLLQ